MKLSKGKTDIGFFSGCFACLVFNFFEAQFHREMTTTLFCCNINKSCAQSSL